MGGLVGWVAGGYS